VPAALRNGLPLFVEKPLACSLRRRASGIPGLGWIDRALWLRDRELAGGFGICAILEHVTVHGASPRAR
jgi:hypothetical protein